MSLVNFKEFGFLNLVEKYQSNLNRHGMLIERDVEEPSISPKEQEYADEMEDEEFDAPMEDSEEDLNPMGDGSDDVLDEEIPTDDKIDMVLDTPTGVLLVQMALDFISEFDNNGGSKYNLTRIDSSINEENALETYKDLAKMLGGEYVRHFGKIRSDLTDSTGIQLLQKIVNVVKRAKFGDIIYDEFRTKVEKKADKENVREVYGKLMEIFDDVSIPI